MPISEAQLLRYYISPVKMAQRWGTIGNVTTTNYIYYVSIGQKFSSLVRTHLNTEYELLRKLYLWEVSRIDTNAAYTLATQFLSAVSIDVQAINRDGLVKILPFLPEGNHGAHFVPIYWVYWEKKEAVGQGSIASVEVLLPTKSLRQLDVKESRYILRRPIKISAFGSSQAKTNAPAQRPQSVR